MNLTDLIVPVDFSECSKAALARASTLAARFGARVHLLHAVPPISYPAPVEFGVPDSLVDDMEERASSKLEEWVGELEKSDISATQNVSRRRAVDAICELAGRYRSQMIVMGTHGHSGLKHAFLGSVAERTLRLAPCPVVTVKESPAEAERAIRRALLCTDFSPDAERAAEIAISLCRDLGAELHLVHVLRLAIPPYVEMPPPEQLLEEVREVSQRKLDVIREKVRSAGIEGTANLVEGEASTEIAKLAKNHALDLVVMGTRGHSGLAHVALGSVAERVLRQVSCSVLTAKIADEG